MMGIPITTAVQVSQERIANLLCSAFEGGSNYWYMIEKAHRPTEFKFRTDPDTTYPLNPGGYLEISADGEEINGKKRWRLDLATIEAGLAVFAEKCPRHFADMISEDDDATTGDCFLQCCLFGEVVFG